MSKFPVAILIGISLTMMSNVAGHYFPPFSIMATAVLPFILVSAINKPFYKASFVSTVLYGYGLIILNDVLIRMYAGGTHDQEGKAWVSLFSFIAFSLSSICMLMYAFSATDLQKAESIKNQRVRNVLIVLLSGGFTAMLYITVLADK